MPRFSVVIPIYNKVPFLAHTLKSVLQQRMDDFELILVNDGSTDSSAEVVAGFSDPRIRYFSRENQGASAARNFGIEQAVSDYITFLDADDYWYPNMLQRMLEAIETYPEQKVFSGAIEVETPWKIFPAQYTVAPRLLFQVVDYFDASMKTTVICTSCAVFHRSVFERVGGFDPHIKSGQDTDLWMRIGLVYPVVFCAEILARYVYDPNSLSKRKEFLNQKMDFEKFKPLEKSHPKLKKFIDQNLFSFAIRSKISGDQAHFKAYVRKIQPENLSLKKRVLLRLPGTLLVGLIALSHWLVRCGWRKSVF